VGIETKTAAIHASFVVDATGRRRWLARQLSLSMQCYGGRRIAWYGYAEGECSECAEAPTLRADANGWTWTARVRPNVYQWTRINFDNRQPAEGWLPADLRGLRVQNRIRGADVTCQTVSRPSGSGYFLVGDAACVVDPLSSHGILKAIMSGMLAAHLIVAAVRGRTSEYDAAGYYSAWLRDWFQRDVERLQDLYSEPLSSQIDLCSKTGC
jgi:flavin-dependent dehydrogenase